MCLIGHLGYVLSLQPGAKTPEYQGTGLELGMVALALSGMQVRLP